MEALRISPLSPATLPLLDPVPALPSVPATTAPGATTLPALVQAPTPTGATFLQALQAAVLPDTLDFALENALRFGAGVTVQAPQGAQPTEAGLELIRDATAVLRIRSLPAQGGESNTFLPSQPPFQGIPSAYAAPPAAAPSPQLDLLA